MLKGPFYGIVQAWSISSQTQKTVNLAHLTMKHIKYCQITNLWIFEALKETNTFSRWLSKDMTSKYLKLNLSNLLLKTTPFITIPKSVNFYSNKRLTTMQDSIKAWIHILVSDIETMQGRLKKIEKWITSQLVLTHIMKSLIKTANLRLNQSQIKRHKNNSKSNIQAWRNCPSVIRLKYIVQGKTFWEIKRTQEKY